MKTTKKSGILPSLMTVLFATIFALAGWSAELPGAGAVYAEDEQSWTPLAIESGYNADVVRERSTCLGIPA